MSKEQTVWGVTSYDRGGNTGYVVHCLFTTKEQAEVYAAEDTDEYSVEEFELYEVAPKPYIYWHRGASVYPDRCVDDWIVERTAQPPGVMPAVDDHLKPFDGHMQGHCGLHISIFGSDRERVEDAYQEQLALALATVNGVCQCGRRDHDFQRDWWS